MIDDLRLSRRRTITADLCIIGAGAAGITLARAFIGSGIQVCVLESGGLEHEDATQALYEGDDAGYRQLYNVGDSRLRFFGGTTNHWVGTCAPLTPLDFIARPWVPHSGWPISRDMLDPYYAQAVRIVELGSGIFDVAAHPEMKSRVPAFDPDRIVPRLWQMSRPTRFGTRYRADLADAANLQVYLHANVIEFVTNREASHVGSVSVRTLDGHEATVTARYFVLACGGIENARLLLASNRVAPGGLGNDHDLVGRFYCDHLRLGDAALAVTTDNRLFDNMVGTFPSGNGAGMEVILCPSPTSQERDRTLNWVAELMTMPLQHDWEIALHRLKNAAAAGRWPDNLTGDIWTVVSNIDEAAAGVYQRYTARPLSVLARCETAPDPESRITLTAERDALGLNKVQRRLRVTALERHTIRSAMRTVGEELGRLGAGRVRLADWLLSEADWPEPELQYGGVHHIGTTRMAADPRHGVVDANCRVHGMHNLYIAGSSVFPTAGYAHPTLSIVAMALRLADHLKQQWLGAAS